MQAFSSQKKLAESLLCPLALSGKLQYVNIQPETSKAKLKVSQMKMVLICQFAKSIQKVFPISLTGLFQRAFMTGIVSPYSDASRKHYPGGGPAGLFAEELAHYVNCPAGNGFTDEETMMSCLREVITEKLINASISLYEEKYKNQVNILLAVVLNIFSKIHKVIGTWRQRHSPILFIIRDSQSYLE